MRISDWSSDVCSSDLPDHGPAWRHLLLRGRGRGDRTQSDAWSPQTEISGDRKSVVLGKSVSVRVDLGGRRIIKKKLHINSAMLTNLRSPPEADKNIQHIPERVSLKTKIANNNK